MSATFSRRVYSEKSEYGGAANASSVLSRPASGCRPSAFRRYPLLELIVIVRAGKGRKEAPGPPTAKFCINPRTQELKMAYQVARCALQSAAAHLYVQVSVSGAIRWRAFAQRSTARPSSERLSEVRTARVMRR